jgi:hypothetical protein
MGNMEQFFNYLYPFVFAIGLAGYGPQLYKLWQDPSAASGMALSTWMIWASTWFISFGYGVTKLNDGMFCLVAGMNFTAHLIIIAMIVWHRRVELAQFFYLQKLQPIYLRERK